MPRLIAALLLVAAVIATAGLVTASTPLGYATLAVVGIAWLVRDDARSTHLTAASGGVSMTRFRRARQRVADLYAKSAAAQPGEVWTTRYAGPDFKGNYFESYIAGEVRILGEECPVVEYRGAKTLGEDSLDMEYLPPWGWIQRLFLIGEAVRGTERTLEPGDTAPEMLNGTTYRGDYLATLPNGAWVTVEYRNPHPTCANQRMVVVGTTYEHDVRGGETGRDVGGDWVPFEQVTGVVAHPSLVDGLFDDEVAS